MYRQLDSSKIDDTITLLSRRVEERFPGSGLARVCRELEAVIKDTERRCRFLAAPMRWLRGWIGLAILHRGALPAAGGSEPPREVGPV